MPFSPKRIPVPVALEPEGDPEFARAAVEAAVALAKSFGARLLLLHAPPQTRPTTTSSIDFTGEMQKALNAVFEAHVAPVPVLVLKPPQGAAE